MQRQSECTVLYIKQARVICLANTSTLWSKSVTTKFMQPMFSGAGHFMLLTKCTHCVIFVPPDSNHDQCGVSSLLKTAYNFEQPSQEQVQHSEPAQ